MFEKYLWKWWNFCGNSKIFFAPKFPLENNFLKTAFITSPGFGCSSTTPGWSSMIRKQSSVTPGWTSTTPRVIPYDFWVTLYDSIMIHYNSKADYSRLILYDSRVIFYDSRVLGDSLRF